MEIRTYDEVDPAQVLQLNMAALWFPFTPALAGALRQHDRRYPSALAYYAVVDGKVAGQAGLLTLEAATTAGPMRFGAPWAVCTLPQYGRQGIARTLMERVEQAARDLDCQAITLGTSRGRVAHRLYRQLGYEDLVLIRHAYDMKPPRPPALEGVRVRPASETDLPALQETFFDATAGRLGFVGKHPNFLEAAVHTEHSMAELHGVWRDRKPAGYIFARQEGDLLRIRCPVLPPGLPLTEVIDQLRALYATPYAMLSDVVLEEHGRPLAAAGYQVEDTWGTFMLKPLVPGLDFPSLLGLNTGHFYLDTLDIT